MSDEFGVDTDKLMDIVDAMARLETRIEAMIAEADSHVGSLHATWDGTAAAMQADAQRRWADGAQEMHEALVKLRDAALKAHGNYTGAAKTNLAMWSR